MSSDNFATSGSYGVNPSLFGDQQENKIGECGADAIEWAVFIFAILTLYVFWWALHLPTLFKKGLRFYINDISWECLRIHSPPSAAILACFAFPRSDWTARFYSARNGRMTPFKIVRAAVSDLAVVVSTVLGIYKLCRGGTQKNLSGLNVSLMMYPSLPQALYGLLLLIFHRTKISSGWIITLCALVISLVAVANALVIHYLYPPDRNIWIASTVFFLLGSFPWIVFSPRLLFLTLVITAFTRNLGMIGAGLAPKAYFPFCAFRGWKAAGPFLAFALSAVFFAVYGLIKARPVDEDGQLPSEALAAERLAMEQRKQRYQQENLQRVARDQEKYNQVTGAKKFWLYLTKYNE